MFGFHSILGIFYSGSGKAAPSSNLDGGNGEANHAWNAVYLAGSWRLVDATWGSGSYNPTTHRFERRLNEHFFLTDPEELIYTHFPYDEVLTPLSILKMLFPTNFETFE